VVTLNEICEQTSLSFPSAAKGMQALETLEIAQEITGNRRNRVFAYREHLAILSEGAEPL
jgi:DNA-binding transcriptional regulator GbsR (MarR family)